MSLSIQSIGSLLEETNKINHDIIMEETYLKVFINTDENQCSIYTKTPNSWKNFRKEMALLFPGENIDSLNKYWTDFERDKITIEDERTYKIFLEANKFTYRKIYLEKPIDANPGEIHENVSCNECKMRTIKGFRYKCVQCLEYNLCENCERRKVHNDHVMFRFPIPLKKMPINRNMMKRSDNFNDSSSAIDNDTTAGATSAPQQRNRQDHPDQSDIIISSLKDVAKSMVLVQSGENNNNNNNVEQIRGVDNDNKGKKADKKLGNNGEILENLNEMFSKLPKTSSITLTVHVSNDADNENSIKTIIDLKENRKNVQENSEVLNESNETPLKKNTSKGPKKSSFNKNSPSTSKLSIDENKEMAQNDWSILPDSSKSNGTTGVDENTSIEFKFGKESVKSKATDQNGLTPNNRICSKTDKDYNNDDKENEKKSSNIKTENENTLEMEQRQSKPAEGKENKKSQQRKTLCKVVYHKDPRINEALHALTAIGFTNDRHRLSQLLESIGNN